MPQPFETSSRSDPQHQRTKVLDREERHGVEGVDTHTLNSDNLHELTNPINQYDQQHNDDPTGCGRPRSDTTRHYGRRGGLNKKHVSSGPANSASSISTPEQLVNQDQDHAETVAACTGHDEDGSEDGMAPQQSQQKPSQSHQSEQPTVQTRLSSSVLRAYHRLFKSFRKAWTGVRFDDEVETIQTPAPRYQCERIEDLLKRTKFNRSELKAMYQGFKQVCPSGLVDENTFRDIYAQFFPQGDATLYAHYLFLAFDQDHNGTVTFHDFVTGLSALSRGTPMEKLQWAFHLYDINGDGRITRDEMMEIIYSVHSLHADRDRADSADGDDRHSYNSDAPQQHANRVFQKLDLNNDGVVTFDEFVTTCLNDQNIIESLSILDTVL